MPFIDPWHPHTSYVFIGRSLPKGGTRTRAAVLLCVRRVWFCDQPLLHRSLRYSPTLLRGGLSHLTTATRTPPSGRRPRAGELPRPSGSCPRLHMTRRYTETKKQQLFFGFLPCTVPCAAFVWCTQACLFFSVGTDWHITAPVALSSVQQRWRPSVASSSIGCCVKSSNYFKHHRLGTRMMSGVVYSLVTHFHSSRQGV